MTDTSSSRDEEIPTPMAEVLKIAAEMPDCGCTDGSFIYGCTHRVRRLCEALIRLSAEREKEREEFERENEAPDEFFTWFTNYMEELECCCSGKGATPPMMWPEKIQCAIKKQTESLTDTLAERDKELSRLRALVEQFNQSGIAEMKAQFTVVERDKEIEILKRRLKLEGNASHDAAIKLYAAQDAIAERDKELAEVKRELAMTTDAANKGDAARTRAGAFSDMIDDLEAQLLAAQTVISLLKKFRANHGLQHSGICAYRPGQLNMNCTCGCDELTDSLLASPDPTLLDEVVKFIQQIHEVMPSPESKQLLSRLRQSTSETEREGL